MTYSIIEIESAINYWRASEPSLDSVSLCKPARALAEVYGRMIFNHVKEVDGSSLNDVQCRALTEAVERQGAAAKP